MFGGGRSGAAILSKIGEQRVHRRIFGRVDQRSAFAPEGDQPRLPELREMKRQGCRGHAELFGDLTGRQTLRPGLDEAAKDIEPSALTQSDATGSRLSLARMSSAGLVQTNGLGLRLCSRM